MGQTTSWEPLQNRALSSRNMTDIVSLNVGGTIYTTSRATLTRFLDTTLGSMFSGRLPSIRDDKGNYLIDRDGSLFRYVLNFLRRSILVLPEDFKEFDMLAQEAAYYQIKGLIDAVDRAKSEHVKEQEVLEVEHLNEKYWTIYGSSEFLQKIPIVLEAWGHLGYVKGSSEDPIFGPEEGGFTFSSGTSLSRIKFFRQITQLGFKLVSVSSKASVDRWVFTRGGGTCTTPTIAK